MSTYLIHRKVVAFGDLLVQLLDAGKPGDEARWTAVGQLAVEHELWLGHVGLVAPVKVIDVRCRGHCAPCQILAVKAVVILVEKMVVGIFRHGRGWVRDFCTLLVEQRHLGLDASHTRLVRQSEIEGIRIDDSSERGIGE